MVGRTVVIGDIPWVAQSAEAFLSKIFACSYSIAGLNVLSGNPADHLVHRHTHRVVRGTLLVCGRPDGRLSALTSLESAVCLSVSQASSIQSIGGTCESVTIGHNPFKLSLAAHTITLEAHRPKFLCEAILDFLQVDNSGRNSKENSINYVSDHEDDDNDSSDSSILSQDQQVKYVTAEVMKEENIQPRPIKISVPKGSFRKSPSNISLSGEKAPEAPKRVILRGRSQRRGSHASRASDDASQMSTSQILGTYSDLQSRGQDPSMAASLDQMGFATGSLGGDHTYKHVIGDMINTTTELLRLRQVFDEIDTGKCP